MQPTARLESRIIHPQPALPRGEAIARALRPVAVRNGTVETVAARAGAGTADACIGYMLKESEMGLITIFDSPKVAPPPAARITEEHDPPVDLLVRLVPSRASQRSESLEEQYTLVQMRFEEYRARLELEQLWEGEEAPAL